MILIRKLGKTASLQTQNLAGVLMPTCTLEIRSLQHILATPPTQKLNVLLTSQLPSYLPT